MLSARALKTWALRAAVFTAAVVLGAAATAVAVIAVLGLAISHDPTQRVDVVLVGLSAIGILIGIGAAVTGMRRTAIGAGVVVSITLVGLVLWPEPQFDAGAFRRAVEARNYDAVEVQAYRAIDQGVLIGQSKDDIRRLLGSPDRATRRAWDWSVGTINDGIGVGDGGAFFIRFRGDRVASAEVGHG